ncbi:MAG: type II toxin-antitoxin system Phd/YefM family antitoxin [Limisphaerales bacterium]
MKTATVQEAKDRWAEVLEWVAAGEEVQVTSQNKVVAKVVPASAPPIPQPDFLGRAQAIWGEDPQGQPLSEIVTGGRGGQS